jgi:hypothetical protein
MLVVRFGFDSVKSLVARQSTVLPLHLALALKSKTGQSTIGSFGVGANYRLHSAGVPSMLALFYLLGEYRSFHSIPNVHFSG